MEKILEQENSNVRVDSKQKRDVINKYSKMIGKSIQP